MKTLHFDDVTVDKVIDGIERFPALNAFPDIDMELFDQNIEWMHPFYEPVSKMILLSMHSYLIRTKTLNILVDTCIGNDKHRVGQGPIYKQNEGILSHWNNRNSDYIQNLESFGLSTESIDIVMCTHLHADHVGWNTRLENGNWVPTFPNAKYLFSDKDLENMKKESNSPFDEYTKLVYQDSILPIMESGQATMIDDSTDLGREINLIKTPGHSPGHYCLEIDSNNKKGMLTGDILHNPIQVTCPSLSTVFCDDKDLSNQTRMKIVDNLTDTNTVVLAAHFSGTTAGLINSHNNSRRFDLI